MIPWIMFPNSSTDLAFSHLQFSGKAKENEHRPSYQGQQKSLYQSPGTMYIKLVNLKANFVLIFITQA